MTTACRAVSRLAGTLSALAAGALTGAAAPGVAWAASEWNALGAVARSAALLETTALALAAACLLGLAALAAFHVLRALRWLPRTRELQIARWLRVAFGALVLGATTFPYLILNFSALMTATIAIAMLLSFVAFVWNQSAFGDLELRGR